MKVDVSMAGSPSLAAVEQQACCIAVFLCVWSAMHIPIPARHTSQTENFFYKVKLAVFAIIAPEVVFLFAIDSYFFIREALDELPSSLLEVRMIYLPSCFLLSMTPC
jgi:hypothetical protein